MMGHSHTYLPTCRIGLDDVRSFELFANYIDGLLARE